MTGSEVIVSTSFSSWSSEMAAHQSLCSKVSACEKAISFGHFCQMLAHGGLS